MISTTTRPAAPPQPASLRHWRLAAGLGGMVGGAIILTGAFLPWVETFAGLIGIPGIRGGNGRIMAAAGILIAAAGLVHALRGGSRLRWLVGIGGFAALGFSAYLLIQLVATLRTLGGDSMVLARGGPGLWVSAGGSLLAFATLFLPAPAAAPPARVPARRLALRDRTARTGHQVAAKTADLESHGARRALQIALGVVWLLDGILQLQPYMFGPGFASMLRTPATGNAGLLASPILWASHMVGQNAMALNTTFALVQLAIGAGLLWRPTVKAALAGSLAWSLAVWWLGEGLGGLLTGTASPVTGAPGAVILYALLAVLVWPARSGDPGRLGDIAGDGLLGSRGSRAAWLVLWGGFGYLILQPAVRVPGGLRDVLTANAAGEPGWLAALDHATTAVVGSHSAVVCVILAVLFAAIATGIHRAAARAARCRLLAEPTAAGRGLPRRHAASSSGWQRCGKGSQAGPAAVTAGVVGCGWRAWKWLARRAGVGVGASRPGDRGVLPLPSVPGSRPVGRRPEGG